MKYSYPVLRCGLLTVLALNLAFLQSDLYGQSDIVFMTADTPSKLIRFESGVETYAVDTGSNGLFHGVTILNGEVLVADVSAAAIQRFSPDGIYLGVLKSVEGNPTFLESDSSGNIYVSTQTGIVERLDSAGNITGSYGPIDLSDGSIFGVDADALGNVYVVGSSAPGASFLYKNPIFGTEANKVSLPGFPLDIAIDEASNLLYMVDGFGGTSGIRIYDIAGATPIFVGTIQTPPSTSLLGIHFATESGNILVTDRGAFGPRGLEFSPSGALLREYIPSGTILPGDIVTMIPIIPEPSSTVMAVMAFMGAIAVASLHRSAKPSKS